MKISEMFIGRDANKVAIANFMYLYLFGIHHPTLELAYSRIEQIHGQLYRYR